MPLSRARSGGCAGRACGARTWRHRWRGRKRQLPARLSLLRRPLRSRRSGSGAARLPAALPAGGGGAGSRATPGSACGATPARARMVAAGAGRRRAGRRPRSSRTGKLLSSELLLSLLASSLLPVPPSESLLLLLRLRSLCLLRAVGGVLSSPPAPCRMALTF